MVEDARFCHRCGRPLDGIDPMPEETPEPTPEPVPVIEIEFEPPPPITFRNGLAVRVGLIASALSIVLLLFGGLMGAMALNMLFLVFVSAFAGFYAVLLYKRRSGQVLDVRAGARLGWMTGIFSFVMNTILFTLTMLALSERGGLAELYRESATKMGVPQATMEQALKTFQDPAMVAVFLAVSLLLMFLFYTVASSLGGALGAKLLDRR